MLVDGTYYILHLLYYIMDDVHDVWIIFIGGRSSRCLLFLSCTEKKEKKEKGNKGGVSKQVMLGAQDKIQVPKTHKLSIASIVNSLFLLSPTSWSNIAKLALKCRARIRSEVNMYVMGARIIRIPLETSRNI
uniref:Uncharacterized protein n=1 Tax=Cacopsylla melanoneura TaxID=428564 RepID=A0A8D8YA61_9HEMI